MEITQEKLFKISEKKGRITNTMYILTPTGFKDVNVYN